MSAITAIAIDLLDPPALSAPVVRGFVDYLLQEGYVSLEGDTQICAGYAEDEMDEPGAPDPSLGDDSEDWTSWDQWDAMIQRCGPGRINLDVSVFSRYGSSDKLYSFAATELSCEVEAVVESLAEKLECRGGFDMYLGVLIGSLINMSSGERDGWGVAIQGEGWFDGPLEQLEQALMEESPRFRAMREAMERLFGCATRIDMRVMG